MKIDNIDRAMKLLRKLAQVQATFEAVSDIPKDWITMKVVIISPGNKAVEYNINNDIMGADLIVLKTLAVLEDEISNIMLEIKTL